MIVFTTDCDRDLKREEAAASMAPPAGAVAGKKKKEAVASERRVPLACLLPNESTAEARPAAAGKKMEEATAETKRRKEATAKKKMEEALTAEKKMEQAVSEWGDGALSSKEEGDSLWEEGKMLKLREELWEAEDLWSEKLVPGALDRWLKGKDAATQVPTVAGKKRKVVRVIVPDSYIDYIKENPGMMRELSDEEMAECPERFRQTYAITKVINAKNRAYQQALLDQYRAFGFAYDEKEVTDDDEKEITDKEEVAVVNN